MVEPVREMSQGTSGSFLTGGHFNTVFHFINPTQLQSLALVFVYM